MLFPLRNRKSKTPAKPLPYSAGKAEVKKSVLSSTLELNILTAPPVEYTKWFGLGISAPSKRHKTVFGEFPLITISLFKSSPFPVTPAKFCTCLAGSPKEAAYKLASSIFKERALTDENSLTVSSFFLPPTTITSSNFSKSSINPIFKTTSLPDVTFKFDSVMVS